MVAVSRGVDGSSKWQWIRCRREYATVGTADGERISSRVVKNEWLR